MNIEDGIYVSFGMGIYNYRFLSFKQRKVKLSNTFLVIFFAIIRLPHEFLTFKLTSTFNSKIHQDAGESK